MLLKLILFAFPLAAATGFLDRTVEMDGTRYAYQIYVPRGYTPDKEWPAVLFLHGVGQSGEDGLRQTSIGLPAAIREFPERFPVIAVLPQTPYGEAWIGKGVKIALTALDQTTREFRIDRRRIHLTGLSMGGLGVLMTAMASPERFASLSILCGALEIPATIPPQFREKAKTLRLPGVDELSARLRQVRAIRFYAGGRDRAIPPEMVLRTVRPLQQAGIPVEYQELPNADHNVWDPVYRDPGFATWLLGNSLPEAGTRP